MTTMTPEEMETKALGPDVQLVDRLAGDGLYYLATPYSDAPGGQEHAYRIACIIAANLIRKGVMVFSPIAHGHPIATLGGIEGRDGLTWERINGDVLATCEGLIVAMMPGWDTSAGIKAEIQAAYDWMMPIWYMDGEGVLTRERPEPEQEAA